MGRPSPASSNNRLRRHKCLLAIGEVAALDTVLGKVIAYLAGEMLAELLPRC